MLDKQITLAWTGASGAPYGLRLTESLLAQGYRLHLLISGAAQVVLRTEAGLDVPSAPKAATEWLCRHFGVASAQLQVHGRQEWFAPVASGSAAPKQMVVCPCSTGTLSAIACGASDNLIERAADVILKERGQLLLIIREMPLSAIHLENMLKLARLGATIMPAAPGFYHQPKGIEDLVDFVVARILDHLGVEQQLLGAWGYQHKPPER
jgi:4-hydroxy-3-polyprenylbenzoate decarboxylase